MLDDVPPNDGIKSTFGERVRHVIEIVNDIGISIRISIHPQRAGGLVAAAADIQNTLTGQARHPLGKDIRHRCHVVPNHAPCAEPLGCNWHPGD